MRFERGIAWYTDLEADVAVHFPEGHIACQYCRLFCRYEENFKRYSCRLTEEWLIDPFHERGRLCPLKRGEKKQDEG